MTYFAGAALTVSMLLVPSAEASTPTDQLVQASRMPSAKPADFALLLAPGPLVDPPAPDDGATPIVDSVNPIAVTPSSKPRMIRWVYTLGTQLPDAVRQHPEDVDVISPGWFHLDAHGDVYGNDVPQITRWAHDHGIKIMPIVDNDEFDGDSAHSILVDGAIQTRALNGLQWMVNNYNYDGVNIDWENIYSSDRDLFSGFMANVYSRIHKEVGKTVTLALGSKTREDYTGFAGPFDYAKLAPNFDLAVIMTYDQHYAGGEPGPVASIQWVDDVINYATKSIPASKLLLGLPFYGYNWNVTLGGWARAMSYTDIVQTVFDHGSSIQMDPASQTPVYTYSNASGTHQIWFENSTSLQAKLALAAKHNLGGWGAWRAGLEDKHVWSLNLSPSA